MCTFTKKIDVEVWKMRLSLYYRCLATLTVAHLYQKLDIEVWKVRHSLYYRCLATLIAAHLYQKLYI